MFPGSDWVRRPFAQRIRRANGCDPADSRRACAGAGEGRRADRGGALCRLAGGFTVREVTGEGVQGRRHLVLKLFAAQAGEHEPPPERPGCPVHPTVTRVPFPSRTMDQRHSIRRTWRGRRARYLGARKEPVGR